MKRNQAWLDIYVSDQGDGDMLFSRSSPVPIANGASLHLDYSCNPSEHDIVMSKLVESGQLKLFCCTDAADIFVVIAASEELLHALHGFPSHLNQNYQCNAWRMIHSCSDLNPIPEDWALPHILLFKTVPIEVKHTGPQIDDPPRPIEEKNLEGAVKTLLAKLASKQPRVIYPLPFMCFFEPRSGSVLPASELSKIEKSPNVVVIVKQKFRQSRLTAAVLQASSPHRTLIFSDKHEKWIARNSLLLNHCVLTGDLVWQYHRRDKSFISPSTNVTLLRNLTQKHYVERVIAENVALDHVRALFTSPIDELLVLIDPDVPLPPWLSQFGHELDAQFPIPQVQKVVFASDPWEQIMSVYLSRLATRQDVQLHTYGQITEAHAVHTIRSLQNFDSILRELYDEIRACPCDEKWPKWLHNIKAALLKQKFPQRFPTTSNKLSRFGEDVALYLSELKHRCFVIVADEVEVQALRGSDKLKNVATRSWRDTATEASVIFGKDMYLYSVDGLAGVRQIVITNLRSSVKSVAYVSSPLSISMLTQHPKHNFSRSRWIKKFLRYYKNEIAITVLVPAGSIDEVCAEQIQDTFSSLVDCPEDFAQWYHAAEVLSQRHGHNTMKGMAISRAPKQAKAKTAAAPAQNPGK